MRDEMRMEKRREREREMCMSNMGTEQRAKVLARQQNRNILEKIALGLAKPTLSKESMLDSRLFNQKSLSGSFGDEESYHLYDKPLFHGSSAAAALYKARGNIAEGDEVCSGGGTEEGIGRALDNGRFGLGQAQIGFEGAREQEVREGKVLCSLRRIRQTCLVSINSWTRRRAGGNGDWTVKREFLLLLSCACVC